MQYNIHHPNHIDSNQHNCEAEYISKLEIELRQLKEQYYRLYNSNPQPMVIYDKETLKILDANEAAFNFYGYTPDELDHLTILNVRPQEDVEMMMQHLAQPNLPSNSGTWRHIKRNGEIVYMNIVAHDITFNGRPARYVVTSDVTNEVLAREKMKEMMDQLITAKQKAEESDRLKTAFLANMSHEIRTPMNGILGFMELLQQPGLSGDERDEYIRLVKMSGERLMNTIKDIIDISKIEAGAVELKENQVDINKMLICQCDLFKAEAEKKNIRLYIDSLLSYDKAKITTDPYKVETIIINLVKNAIKFTSKGSIALSCIVIDNTLQIKVADTGRGIQKEHIETIFDRFVQANQSYSRDFEGSGLGLSICRSYAEMLDGNISVESIPAKGSVFTLSIPYKPVENYRNTDSKTDQPIEVKRKLNIFLAEDDDVSFLLFKSIVTNLGINLTRACDGQEAIEIIEGNNCNFDLIFMDLKMPNLDGYEATRRIKKRYPAIPIIAITAYAMSDDITRIKNSGFQDYILKPIRIDQISQLISKWAISHHGK